jgi:hypothetical protein
LLRVFVPHSFSAGDATADWTQIASQFLTCFLLSKNWKKHDSLNSLQELQALAAQP